MAKYNAKQQNGRLVISKSNEKLADENTELNKDLDLITKEELIQAIHQLANEISQLKGEEVSVSFTYENSKNKLK